MPAGRVIARRGPHPARGAACLRPLLSQTRTSQCANGRSASRIVFPTTPYLAEKTAERPSTLVRAVHNGSVIPGKVVPSHKCCYVSDDGAEHSHHEYQALVTESSQFDWIPASDGFLPTGAVQGGSCVTGEPLYIGRTYHEGTLTIGKIQPSHRCLYIPYGGEEHCYHDYEVLVCKTVNF
uniref:Putative cytoplasm n=1 Tax=Ixodes ricinus TaxID=34613 RepID=A0A0K8RGT3_IXORI